MYVNDDWNIFHTSWKDSNDIGEHAKKMIDEMPTWLIYLRKNYDMVCPEHYDWATRSPLIFDEYCPNCLGLGYITEAVIIPARFDWTLNKRNIKESDNKLSPGHTEYTHAAVTFSRIISPQMEDIILLPEYNGNHAEVPYNRLIRPVGISAVYSIKAKAHYFERDLGFTHCGIEVVSYKKEWAKNLIENFKLLPILKDDKIWDRSYW